MIERIDSAGTREGVPAASIFAFVSLGSEGAVVAQEAEQEFLDTLPGTEEAALSLDDLVQTCNSKRTAIQSALKVLLTSGRVRFVGRGTKGNARRYFLVETDSDGPG